MTKKECVRDLKGSMELYLFDPGTGETLRPEQLNEDNRMTYEAMKKAVELLEEPPRMITVEELITRLESIKENSESFITEEEPESIWHDDVEALDAAIAIIRDYKNHARVGFIALP